MAKRRRLVSEPILPVPARPGLIPSLEMKGNLRPDFDTEPLPPRSKVHPPIAQVAGQAAVTAALQEVSEALMQARDEGRLIQRLPLDVIDAGYLVRDRLSTDEPEMTTLIDSLRTHGQRTPIEVTQIEPGRYGLISGWRRLTALARLAEETGDARFTTVLALLRQPETAGEAYVTMVEENEIRLGLSYYERARIAAKAVDLGVFSSEKQALQRLYAAASRSKRSKIGTFLRLYRLLDGVLRYPASLTERLGLGLAQIAEANPTRLMPLIEDMTRDPPCDPAAEQLRLTKFVKHQSVDRRLETDLPNDDSSQSRSALSQPETRDAPASDTTEVLPGVFLRIDGGLTRPILTLFGPGVGPDFRERLTQWLQAGR